KLRTMSWQYFDFDDMAKSTLGYHWRELTSAQRQEFVPLFAEFIQDAFLSKLEQSTVKMVQQEARTARIQYLKQIYLSPDDAEVQTSVTVQDQRAPLAVDFKMFRSDGQWRVYDITIDAISIIANYRNQFDRVINQRGFDVLVADLKAKRQQLQEYMRSEAHAAANR
ncbi:MAG TPA: ABC transporter substrate-binding protein, partial [Candidatus Binataceae bacterium]|nr:ABC transporter substrate-binding protein [Candidatus Binataceae bacterium]